MTWPDEMSISTFTANYASTKLYYIVHGYCQTLTSALNSIKDDLTVKLSVFQSNVTSLQTYMQQIISTTVIDDNFIGLEYYNCVKL